MKDKRLSNYFRRMSAKAAKMRMKKISPAERKRIATEAARARWAKHKKEKRT